MMMIRRHTAVAGLVTALLVSWCVSTSTGAETIGESRNDASCINHDADASSSKSPVAAEDVGDYEDTIDTPDQQEGKINALLALVKSSLSCGKGDKEVVLKNAKILLSDFVGNDEDQTYAAALAEIVTESQEATEREDLGEDTPQQCTASSAEDIFLNYADRHARRLEDIVDDFDCMEREFDVSDPNFDRDEAAVVLNKCRLLVLRNVFPKEMMQEYSKKYDDYLLAVHTGKVAKNTKTNDAKAPDVVQDRGRKRHDIMLPKYLAPEQIAGNPRIFEILSHKLALGEGFQLNQLGSVIAESGAPVMYWHSDQDYIYSSDSFQQSGLGGHDLLPYVFSMFVPLLDATSEHGPTEFCVGSSHTTGLPFRPKFLNGTLGGEGSHFRQMQDFQHDETDACPLGHWRVPLVGMGDAVVFDYNVKHRGGPNRSPELRALLYAVYSRGWFRDLNFEYSSEDDDESEDQFNFEKWASGMRYVMVEESEVEHIPHAGTTLASIEGFAGISRDWSQEGFIEFTFTNINVEGASLYVEDEMLVQEMQPKEQWIVSASIGEEVSARDRDGMITQSWIIIPDQGEIVLVKHV
mmetsp:Transcript_29606/g.65208  ORF Transcript_29606/g.65208 Transcript_29606/m.65208 type:complete len:579 (+) Transcript_29606:378-2114(+)